MLDSLECLKLSTSTLLSFTLLAISVKLYLKLTTGRCKSIQRIDGKVCIVTGANSGIGYETAKELVARGGKVYMACRDIIKAIEASEKIREETGSLKVFVKKLDLSSLSSVREFCNDFLCDENRLDLLICNGGICYPKKSFTDEGLELNLATNYLGHFLMTNILMGKMKKTFSIGGSRIIIATSSIHSKVTKSDFDLNNLNSVNSKDWDCMSIYANTKLCNILMTRELSRRLNHDESSPTRSPKICVNCVNPGATSTNIMRHFKTNILLRIIYGLFSFFSKSAYEGAQTIIHLAVSQEVQNETGKYWSDCKISNFSGLAEDMTLAKKLWEKSEDFVGLQTDDYHLSKKQVRFSLKN